jgi:mono/diheme cytochrome c family protein
MEMTTMSETSYAVLGIFDTPNALMQAIPKARAARLGTVEAYTPYPIHGIDEALGLRRSPLGGMVLVMGVLGAVTALGFQYWISAIDYPIITGGKSAGSWEAFIPIMFEVTVLFATFTAGLGMLFLLNKLPFFGHPVLSSKAISGITRDRYALALEAEDESFDSAAAAQVLRDAGALEIELLPALDRSPFLTSDFILRTLGGIFVACVVSGFAMFFLTKWFPLLAPMKHMQDQPRLNAQKGSTFFKDGHGMQLPVAGTVARGYLPTATGTQDAAATLVNPLPRTKEVFAIGRRAYANRCEVCHGAIGNGVGSLTSAYGGKAANLQAQQFRDYPDGKIYWVLVNGKNNMPSHAPYLSESERWAVVHYVRALQRAQNAKDEDLKVAR